MNRWLAALCVSSAATQATQYGIRVLIVYQALELDASVLAVGALTALYSFAPAFIAVRLGRLSDRGNARLLLLLGSLVTVASGIGVAVSPSLTILAVANVAMGAAQLTTTISSQTLVSRLSSEAELDTHFSAWSLSAALGQTIGLPLTGVIAASWGAPGAPAILVAAVVMSALTFATLPAVLSIKEPPQSRVANERARTTVRELISPAGMKPAMFSSLVVLAGMDLLATFLPVLGEELGFSVLTVTVLLAIRTAAALVVRAFLPILLRRTSRRVLLVTATLMSGLTMTVLPAFQTPLLLGTALAIIGTFWGIGQPLTMTWVISLARRDDAGLALATRMMANRTGQVLIPLAAGGLAGATGVGSVFVASGALLLCSSAATIRSTRS